MKLSSIFLAAVMVSAMAGQAAEARDHDGWRNQQKAMRHYQKQMRQQQRWNNRNWRNNSILPFNNGFQRGYDPGNQRPWDNAHDNAIRAEQAIRAQQAAQARGYWY